MILIDTGPLIAIVDDRDSLHKRAIRDLKRIRRLSLTTCSPVLTEVNFALPASYQRRRLRELMARLDVRPYAVEQEEVIWDATFAWLEKYSEHEPDWTDAYLAVISGHDQRLKIWTYDTEFRDLWRRLDGTPVPLAIPI